MPLPQAFSRIAMRSSRANHSLSASAVALLLATFTGVASAQVNCEAMPAGPERTDCYIGLSRLSQGQSDIVAGKTGVRSGAARYRAVTGTDTPKHKPHRQQ